ncbi:MAG: hypothetical protein COA34_010060 [Methylophaga sp.]|uniref:hypothetical protein n=1 Tax=Methylophaga sp. TaxID=2024840 RepID=UPI000C11BB4E|nr:hypothetical protein [Methylophaga sp.]MBL1458183.1 hypothetical protein [Methylophaga sp.]
MKHPHIQQFDQRPANFWQLCVLLLLLNSLAFTSWIDFRQANLSGDSGFVADFNQLTLANHRDHFRSLLDLKNLPAPNTFDGDNEHHWLVFSSLLFLPVSILLQTDALGYLTLLIPSNAKFYLPLNRAPPNSY